MKKKIPKKAAALGYQHGQQSAPRVIAKGRGKIAEKIVTLANEHQVPLVEDRNLVELLEALDVDTQIPAELYQAVAEVLVFIYQLNQESP